MMQYDSVVLAGGSIKGLGILGSLQYCFDNKIISNDIDLWVGTSVGSLIAYLLIIGYTPIEILTVIIKNMKLFNEYSNIDFIGLILDKGGASYDNIQMLMERLTIDKVGRLYTLGKLRESFGKSLVCCTYNYTRKRVEYLNPIDNPDLPAITACKMSSTIPIFFEKFKYNDCFYIDGGAYDNFSLDYPINVGKINPIGINIEPTFSEDEKIGSYVFNLYKIMSNSITNQKMEIFKDKVKVINLTMPSINIWDGDYTPKIFIDLFSSGYNQTQELISCKDETELILDEDDILNLC